MKYTTPEMKVVMFETEDVIVAASGAVVPTEAPTTEDKVPEGSED